MTSETDAELWLIRHGQSIGNRDNIYQGQNDLPLSPLGRDQADVLADRLVALHGKCDFSAIYASDLQRATETARPTAQRLKMPVIIRPNLREIDVGGWSGLTFADIQERFAAEWADSYPVMNPERVRGGGESYRQAQERVVDALAAITNEHPGERVLVFFHGGVLQAALAHIMQMPLANKRFLRTSNTSISRVRLRAKQNRLDGVVLGINDVAHLETRNGDLSTETPE